MQNQTGSPRENLQVREIHRKQFLLQILLPVVLGSLILLAVGGIAAGSPGDRSAVWANISTIFMSILFALAGFLQLGVLLLLIFGTKWVHEKLPGGSYLVHAYLALFSHELKGIDDKVSSPWISIRSSWAGIRRIFRR